MHNGQGDAGEEIAESYHNIFSRLLNTRWTDNELNGQGPRDRYIVKVMKFSTTFVMLL